MKTEDLVDLTNGLSVTACGQTLVCDRARLIPVREGALDLAFLIAGTDIVPRLRLTIERLSRTTADEMAAVVRRVARAAALPAPCR
jgi:hypothetical protein